MEPQKSKNPYYRNDPDLRFAVLTAEQEATLFARMKGDDKALAEEARTFLIENHLLFAQTCAQKIAKGRLPGDQVISAANEALMLCIDRFGAVGKARFTTYLRFYIQRGVSKIWQSMHPVDYKRHFPPAENSDGKPFFRPLESQTHTPDYAGEDFKRVALELLDKFKEQLTEEERSLLTAVYEEGKSFAEIGRASGLSRQAILNHHTAAIQKLRRLFRKAPELQ